ncbi:MAG TPA: peroxiredoxin [Hyphomicrobiaceae bacterium]|nr:peroxiredoxin [Hyphomicrobiaceae bacterium]
MLQDGDLAPEFELATDAGETVTLSRLRGKPVVVYFYPKDDTSGCTIEAKDFSRLAAEFRKAGVEVIGVSPDSVESHQKFRAKYNLAVRLAADPDKVAANAYGVWVQKSMYGRSYMGVERSTFLVDKAGRVARSWRKVKVPEHAEEVLAAARALVAT